MMSFCSKFLFYGLWEFFANAKCFVKQIKTRFQFIIIFFSESPFFVCISTENFCLRFNGFDNENADKGEECIFAPLFF